MEFLTKVSKMKREVDWKMKPSLLGENKISILMIAFLLKDQMIGHHYLLIKIK